MSFDVGEVVVAEEPGALTGVAIVGLDLLAGVGLGVGGRNDDGVDLEVEYLADEHGAGRFDLVADPEVLEFDAELFG